MEERNEIHNHTMNGEDERKGWWHVTRGKNGKTEEKKYEVSPNWQKGTTMWKIYDNWINKHQSKFWVELILNLKWDLILYNFSQNCFWFDEIQSRSFKQWPSMAATTRYIIYNIYIHTRGHRRTKNHIIRLSDLQPLRRNPARRRPVVIIMSHRRPWTWRRVC